MIKDFCAFILTHGRADNVRTYRTVREQGYTGPIVIVIDDEDIQRQKYIDKFGSENVEIFSKTKIAKTFDRCDNFDKRGAIIYARNACFDIAKKRGYTYFIELDDDYTSFSYRFDAELNYIETKIKNLDAVWSRMLAYYIDNPRFASIAMAQGGDFIGGRNSGFGQMKPKRKAMNSFICSTERRFTFIGTINEDVNTYTNKATTGMLFLTIPLVCLHQQTTQRTPGGMTELYLDSGTYLKSFYSVMLTPSAVKIAVMGGDAEKRLHHFVEWNHCCPKIISDRHKKRNFGRFNGLLGID